MTSKQKQEILKSLCVEGLSPVVSNPYQINAGGKLYEVATDGHLLLAFEVGKSDLPLLPDKWKQTAVSIAGWLQEKPTHAINDVADFAGFLNLDGCAKCPMCAGTGKRTPESKDFGEMGFDDPIDDARYVKLEGFPLNANLLAQTMIFLEIGMVHSLLFRVDPVEEKPGGTRFTFFGPGWIISQMGVVAKVEAEAKEPLPVWSDFEAIA